ncbi:MAG TPA: GYF domain-containing protein [Polyangiaceae bacterium]
MTPPSDKRTASSESRGGWLVNVADDVVAPMTTLEVIDALRKGRLTEQSLVWRIGMHDWSAVQDVPQLRLAAGFTPVPSLAAPLPLERPQSMMPSSLAPTTAEAEARDPASAVGAGASAWGNIDELLSNERRADQRSSRRVVIGAALGSAALASVFTLCLLLRAPTPQVAQPAEPPVAAARASEAPALAPTLETSARAPSASTPLPAASAPRVSPKETPPRSAKRPKRAAPSASAVSGSEAPAAAPLDAPGAEPVAAPAADPTTTAPSVTVVPVVSAAPSAQP